MALECAGRYVWWHLLCRHSWQRHICNTLVASLLHRHTCCISKSQRTGSMRHHHHVLVAACCVRFTTPASRSRTTLALQHSLSCLSTHLAILFRLNTLSHAREQKRETGERTRWVPCRRCSCIWTAVSGAVTSGTVTSSAIGSTSAFSPVGSCVNALCFCPSSALFLSLCCARTRSLPLSLALSLSLSLALAHSPTHTLSASLTLSRARARARSLFLSSSLSSQRHTTHRSKQLETVKKSI